MARLILILLLFLFPLADRAAAQRPANEAVAERVSFPGSDGRTTLVGYVFKPRRTTSSPSPAVVMMHGRAGAYSSRANGRYDATTPSLRHKAWGRIWADAGYVALLVDGFGPRGHPAGFPRFSYDDRPAELDEVTVRPRDAYAALAYLRSRRDVAGDRVGLQGWSNGGSAAIATIDRSAPGIREPAPTTGFRAALVFYPACGLKGIFAETPFRPYAPTLVLHGSADEEVSAKRCSNLVERSRADGGSAEIHIYPGATHGFDSPAGSRQRVQANAIATDDAIVRAIAFFARHVGSK